MTLEWRSNSLVEVEFGKHWDLFATMKIIRWVGFNSGDQDCEFCLTVLHAFNYLLIHCICTQTCKHKNINSRTRAHTHTGPAFTVDEA